MANKLLFRVKIFFTKRLLPLPNKVMMAVSLRQLAGDCGVSDSLLHHHFGSKHQLWQEAADNSYCTVNEHPYRQT
jgi:hypothetical protein